MTARYYIGDVHQRMAEMEDGTYELVITSPPFLALRSYLPDGHPLKHLEIGSEETPAAFLDVMLALTAEWGRLLAPHGSIAIEIGDTYSGSGGAGGDYADDGLRDGQAKFRQKHSDAWPMAKSLAMIPELYAASLAYGRNLLTGETSPAGRWRVRNFKPWIRSNPPVGALGDKERPATSYVTVATRATNRYFDLNAVRTAAAPPSGAQGHGPKRRTTLQGGDFGAYTDDMRAAGAPPLDWWHQADAIIDAEIDRRAGKRANARTAKGTDQQARSGKSGDRDGNWGSLPELHETNGAVGARGVHIRRALERGGILSTVDALDVSPKGYKGAHYAVWPMELVKLLVQEMCPHRVCTTCGQPSRRIVETSYEGTTTRRNASKASTAVADGVSSGHHAHRETNPVTTSITVGWSDCGCPGDDRWRPGRVLDPFAGSGTTLAVATGLGHHADGIDIDTRNAMLAVERVGMWLTIIWPDPDLTLPALPRGDADYSPWVTDQQATTLLHALCALLHTGTTRPPTPTPTAPHRRTQPPPMPGQGDLLSPPTT